jgi:hypothetical protein
MGEEEEVRTKEPPDPMFLGDLLVINLLKPDHKFNIKEERLTEALSSLPDSIRDMVKDWVVIYLAWLFKARTLKKHGQEFTNRFLTYVREALERTAGEAEGLWPVLEYWFANLDNVTDRAGKTVSHWEVPFEVLVAWCFMVFDTKSPYYRNPSAETNMVEFDIGFVLGSAAQEAKQTFQLTIDQGGPVERPGD